MSDFIMDMLELDDFGDVVELCITVICAIFVAAILVKSTRKFREFASRSKFNPARKTYSGYATIGDSFESIEQVQEALIKAGMEASNLILGIDFTASNQWNGRRTFFGKNLHTIEPDVENPYQQVIRVVGRTLERFDEDKLIPAFYFGDVTTKANSVGPFWPDRVAYGFEQVLQRYNEITPHLQLSGPTSFAPLIRQAIEIVKETKEYHILVIIADGQLDSKKDETAAAIIEASNYPISIIMVGVGDGPWDDMEEFDDELRESRFDNFQFVEFSQSRYNRGTPQSDALFARDALMEIPEQYMEIRRLKLI